MTVTILSPHLDDAILSLGAAIAGEKMGRPRIVTVFAGNPESKHAAGPWDSASGFKTLGAASRARRAEDKAACEIVGADPVWLPFSDEQYPAQVDELVWEGIAAELNGTSLLMIPGWPLAQADHRRLSALVAAARPRLPIIGYCEQPYALGRRPPKEWRPIVTPASARKRKGEACACYATQLPQLREQMRLKDPASLYEAVGM